MERSERAGGDEDFVDADAARGFDAGESADEPAGEGILVGEYVVRSAAQFDAIRARARVCCSRYRVQTVAEYQKL